MKVTNMKNTDGLPLHCLPARVRFIYILLLGILFGVIGWNGHAYAEGSRSLYPQTYPAGGYRADLDLEPNLAPYIGEVTSSTFLYVYAQAGEYIVLGSRNRSNGGNINVYNPQNFGVPGAEIYNRLTPGTPDFTCSGGSSQPGPHYFGGTSGTITSRLQELAGPNSADNTVQVTNGFQPCAYLAPVTGSYGVLFFAATNGGANPNGNIGTPIIDNLGVSAWDVTVRANRTSTTDLNGRLYTYAFIGFTNGNSRPVYSSFYYVTQDGYRYRQALDGLDGNGYALYSNSLGFMDNGQPLYKDLRGNDSQISTPIGAGVTTQTAQNPTFFSDISPSGLNATEVNRVLTALNIPIAPTAATVSNVQFVGTVSGTTSYLGTGGTFSFNTTNTITYQIVISLDGINYDPSNINNATLTGLAPSGSNTIVWNGLNNSNVNFPAGGPYYYQVSGRNGEIHFPMLDAENNYYGGPTITRLNGLGAPSTTVYYDDRGYVLSTGFVVGVLNGYLCGDATPPQPVPAYSLTGTDSSTVYRTWGVNAGTSNPSTDCNSTNAWGDAKAVNLWTYYSSTAPLQPLNVIALPVDVGTTVNAADTAIAGSTVQGTFTFANNGTAIAHGVTYTMTLSTGLTNVTFGNLPTGTTATYSAATGIVTFAGTALPTTLTAGQAVLGATTTAPMTYSYTAPASGSVTVHTTIATTDTDGYLTNNSASVTTYVGAVDVQTTINVLQEAAPYGTVTGNIQFTNNGTSAAAGVTYTATIGSASFYPTLITFTSLPTGVTPSYNNTTGIITFTGLPSTLGNSQTFNIGFSYTAPASGVIPATSAITTTSTDPNTANNNSSDTTYVGPDLTVAKTDNGPFTKGTNGTYTITVSNIGTLPSTGTITVVDTLPTGLTYVSGTGTGWTGNCGAVGQVVTCTSSAVISANASGNPLTLTVNVLATATSPLVNNVSVSGGGDVNATNNTATDTTVVAALQDLTITKVANAAPWTQGNTNRTYTITVTNSGTAATSGQITVTDSLPTGLTYVSGTGTGWTGNCSAVGQIVNCTRSDSLGIGASYPALTLTVNVGAAAGSPLVNTATVSGGGETNTSNDTATTSTTVYSTGGYNLQLNKSHVGTSFTQGQTNAQYTITVTNIGSAQSPAGTITVVDTLPAGLTYVSGIGTGWTCNVAGQVVTCTSTTTIPSHNSSNTLTLTVNVASNASSPLINSATVSDSAGGETNTNDNTATDTVTVTQLPDLTVTKSHTGNFYRGQTGAQYTITVNNIGGAPTTAAMTVTDTLPAGLTYVSSVGTGWACGAVGQVVTCTSSAVIAGNSAGNPITLTVNVAAGAGSPLVNNVSVSGGGESNTGNDTATDSTTVSATAPDLTVTKSHVGNFTQGQTGATYTITVSNTGNAATTGATVTVTDTLPADLTATAIAGTGWTCTLSTLTCTRTTVLVAGASYPAITVTVNVALNAGSPLVNTVTVSGGGETNTSNDTATDSTIVNPLPDLTITKTHNIVFYLGQPDAYYTITVNNIAGGNATGTITVTDTLPTGMTFVSGTGTGWSCGAAGQVVTCTSSTAIAANSSSSPLTLTVSISMSAPYALTNSATVALTGQSESNTNNNNASDPTTIIPTLVTLSNFRAYEDKSNMVIEWTTSSEAGTAGFYLFRKDTSTGGYQRINRRLLPALLTSPQGGIYSLIDKGASPGQSYTYVLMEVEAGGAKNIHGPFIVGAGSAINNLGRSNAINPELLLNPPKVSTNTIVRSFASDGSSNMSVRNDPYKTTVDSGQDLFSNYVRKAKESAVPKAAQAVRIRALAASTGSSSVRTGTSIKIPVSADGLYSLSSSTIAALLGMPEQSIRQLIKVNGFQLTNKGLRVAYLPDTGSAGILFYGKGINNDNYTKENIYWLSLGAGVQVVNVTGKSPLPVSGDNTFTEALHTEQDNIVVPVITDDPESDYWFWDFIVGGDPDVGVKTFTIQANGVANTSTTGSLSINLQGFTDTKHHASVKLNGTQIGDNTWYGSDPKTITLNYSQGLLLEGSNTVEVTGLLDNPDLDYSIFYVDSFDLTYRRLYHAINNSLVCHDNTSPVVTITGFTGPDLSLFDITDPLNPRNITAAKISGTGGNYAVSFNTASSNAVYLALKRDAVIPTANVRAGTLPWLKNKSNNADYIIITTPELSDTAKTLAAYRSKQGLTVKTVLLEEVLNEFNYGIYSPKAIRDFLSYAYHNWSRQPRYVVLAGNGTYDYKNNLAKGDNLVPTLMTSTPSGVYPSDNLFAEVENDHVPRIAIGRLPVLTASDLTNVINKIAVFEGTTGNRVIMLADKPDDGGDFTQDSNDVAALLPKSYSAEKIYLSEQSIDTARSTLKDRINKGIVFLNYIGHGGVDHLAMQSVLTEDDVAAMTNSTKLPVMAAMTCVVGEYAIPGYNSLSEALVLKKDGGAAAVWSPTGLSFDSQAKILDEEFFKADFNAKKAVLGDVILKAFNGFNNAGGQAFMIDIYNLLGDPALKLR